jgi:hypothetical protein
MHAVRDVRRASYVLTITRGRGRTASVRRFGVKI